MTTSPPNKTSPPNTTPGPSSPKNRRRPRRAAPLVFSLVFVVLAVLVISWQALVRGGGSPAPSGPCDPQPSDRAATTDGILKIGSIFPQTDPTTSPLSRPLIAATELAVNDVNTAGGIPGLAQPRLDPATQLDEGATTPASTTTCASASALLANRSDVVVGPYASVDTLKIDKRVTQAGRLMVSPSNELASLSSEPHEGRYFRTTTTDTVQADLVAQLVAKEGNKHVAVVVSKDPWANSLGPAITSRLTMANTSLSYADTSEFTGIADTIVNGQFDGVVFVGFPEITGLIRTLIDRGVNPQNHRFYGTSGFVQNTASWLTGFGAPQGLVGLRGFVPWAAPDFNNRMQSVKLMPDLTYGAQTYDAVIATSLAAAAARSDDPQQIARELPLVTRGGQKCTTYQACVDLLRQNPNADIDYDGASGPLGFTAQGDLCQGRWLLSAFDASGYLSQRLDDGLSPDQCS